MEWAVKVDSCDELLDFMILLKQWLKYICFMLIIFSSTCFFWITFYKEQCSFWYFIENINICYNVKSLESCNKPYWSWVFFFKNNFWVVSIVSIQKWDSVIFVLCYLIWLWNQGNNNLLKLVWHFPFLCISGTFEITNRLSVTWRFGKIYT